MHVDADAMLNTADEQDHLIESGRALEHTIFRIIERLNASVVLLHGLWLRSQQFWLI